MKTIMMHRGFTLIETLTAIGILSLALIGIVTLYANVFSLLRSDRTFNDASTIARKQMTMASLSPAAGRVRSEMNGISYETITSIIPTNNGLLYAEVIVSWETNGATRRYSLATLIDTN